MLVLFGTQGQVTAWFCFSGFLKVGDGAWTGLPGVPMQAGSGHSARDQGSLSQQTALYKEGFIWRKKPEPFSSEKSRPQAPEGLRLDPAPSSQGNPHG